MLADDVEDGRDVLAAVVPVVGEGLADVDDHVGFGGSVAEGLFGFEGLGTGNGAAVGEADDGADADLAVPARISRLAVETA